MSKILQPIKLILFKYPTGYSYMINLWSINNIGLLDLDATVLRLKEFESRPVYQRVGGSF